MRSSFPIAILIGVLGLLGSYGASLQVTKTVEAWSVEAVQDRFINAGYDDIEVIADGLQIVLTADVATEAERFDIITIAASVVDSARLVENLTVIDGDDVAPPRFSVEILRTLDTVSIIGLVPNEQHRDYALALLKKDVGDQAVKDLLESGNYPEPEQWWESLDFGLQAATLLDQAKISVSAGQVDIEAVAQSTAQKVQWERLLNANASANISTRIDISAPLPVIKPYILRFEIDEDGPRLEACTADSPAAARQIQDAADTAGAAGLARCVIGLGAPTTAWADAAGVAIRALSQFHRGTVTFADGDITLVARDTADEEIFDRVVANLQADLPPTFTLKAVLLLPPDENDTQQQVEFLATLSPEGNVQLRGNLQDELSRDLVTSFAKAQFVGGQVYTAARPSDPVPPGWTKRVMAGLEALGELHNGTLVVTPQDLAVRGVSDDEAAGQRVTQVLSTRLGSSEIYAIDVSYDPALDPMNILLEPAECLARIQEVLDVRKFTFEPGSANLDSDSLEAITTMAEIIDGCHPLAIEIAGHTDSQGREQMNMALSQDRANSVLNAFLAARVVNARFEANGYGESQPIADNATEEGRELNRRIVLSLIGEDSAPENPISEAQTDE